eukprot:620925-Pyramimonas_sp.AAC.1
MGAPVGAPWPGRAGGVHAEVQRWLYDSGAKPTATMRCAAGAANILNRSDGKLCHKGARSHACASD